MQEYAIEIEFAIDYWTRTILYSKQNNDRSAVRFGLVYIQNEIRKHISRQSSLHTIFF